jgi:hypothetical protein
MNKVTQLLTDTDHPASLAARTRARRWLRLQREFPEIAEMNVVDLGGVAKEWLHAPTAPASLTVVNLFDQPTLNDKTKIIVGDACALPPHLLLERFDLVFSNSVIDQVGGHYRRLQFADTVRALADRHWIQTAYRYFPLDAATLFPMQQQLPLRVRAAINRRWPFGYRHADSESDAILLNLGIEGLSRTAFRAYFPDSQIVAERWAGMIKSLIAIGDSVRSGRTSSRSGEARDGQAASSRLPLQP